MIEPTGVAAGAAAMLFNLPVCRVISTTITAGRRQVIVDVMNCLAARVAVSSLPGGKSAVSNG